MIDKAVKWYAAACPATRLSFNVLVACCIYFFVNSFAFVFIKMGWDLLVTMIMMAALGVFSLHMLVGPSKVMTPVYKVLYRLTGNPFYMDPLKIKEEVTDVHE